MKDYHDHCMVRYFDYLLLYNKLSPNLVVYYDNFFSQFCELTAAGKAGVNTYRPVGGGQQLGGQLQLSSPSWVPFHMTTRASLHTMMTKFQESVFQQDEVKAQIS